MTVAPLRAMARTLAWLVIIDGSTKKVSALAVPGATLKRLPSVVGYVAPPSSESETAIVSAVNPVTATSTESYFPAG